MVLTSLSVVLGHHLRKTKTPRMTTIVRALHLKNLKTKCQMKSWPVCSCSRSMLIIPSWSSRPPSSMLLQARTSCIWKHFQDRSLKIWFRAVSLTGILKRFASSPCLTSSMNWSGWLIRISATKSILPGKKPWDIKHQMSRNPKAWYEKYHPRNLKKRPQKLLMTKERN